MRSSRNILRILRRMRTAFLFSLLSQKGLDIHREIWTDPKVRWEDYGLVLIKSPWDYFEKVQPVQPVAG